MKEIPIKIHNKIYELSVPYLISTDYMIVDEILNMYEEHPLDNLIPINDQLHTSYYHCPACKQVTTRQSTKKWLRSWCDVKEVLVRMKFIKHFE